MIAPVLMLISLVILVAHNLSLKAHLRRVEASIPDIVADRINDDMRFAKEREARNLAYRFRSLAEGVEADAGIDKTQPYYC